MMQEALDARQLSMDQVTAIFEDLEAEGRQSGYPVAEHVQQKMETLNADWTKIQQLSKSLEQDDDIIEGGWFTAAHDWRCVILWIDSTVSQRHQC